MQIWEFRCVYGNNFTFSVLSIFPHANWKIYVKLVFRSRTLLPSLDILCWFLHVSWTSIYNGWKIPYLKSWLTKNLYWLDFIYLRLHYGVVERTKQNILEFILKVNIFNLISNFDSYSNSFSAQNFLFMHIQCDNFRTMYTLMGQRGNILVQVYFRT